MLTTKRECVQRLQCEMGWRDAEEEVVATLVGIEDGRQGWKRQTEGLERRGMV